MHPIFTIYPQLIVSRKLVVKESGGTIYEKVYVSPPPPSTISFEDNWMRELDSEVQKSLEAAKTPNESNQNQKPNYQERGDPWVDKNPSKRSRKISCWVTRTSSTQQERERPLGGQESSKVEELDIDFRLSRLSHAVVKEAEHFRVQELVTKIESHLIEKHFKPTCSRMTSTTHGATIRK